MSSNGSTKIILALTMTAAVVVAVISGFLVRGFYERSLLAQFPVEPIIRGNPDARWVFLGDSRVAGWSHHDRIDALYIGFPGATAHQIGNRVDDMPWPANTRTIVIQAGVNDLRILGLRPQDREARVAASHADLLQLVEASLDHAGEVLLMLVLPVGEPRWVRSVVWSDAIGQGVEELNQKLLDHPWPGSVRLIDATAELGPFDASMFTDEMHFSSKAYGALNDLVLRYLKDGRN